MMDLDRCKTLFGDYTPFLQADGSVSAAWPKAILGSFQLPSWIQYTGHPDVRITRVTCHHLLVPRLGSVFLNIYKSGDWPLLRDYGGCYSFRLKRSLSTPSLHSWGVALDLNVDDNPLGGPSHMPKELVQHFRDGGFDWGGTWEHRPDPMHFEWGGGVP